MSQKYSLNEEDFRKILTGLGIAVLGALATYLQETLPNVDFGAWTPVVVAFNSTVVNAIRRYLTGW